jgi:hypothetical protein
LTTCDVDRLNHFWGLYCGSDASVVLFRIEHSFTFAGQTFSILGTAAGIARVVAGFTISVVAKKSLVAIADFLDLIVDCVISTIDACVVDHEKTRNADTS